MSTPTRSPLPGANTLVFGPAGAGKTTALKTFLDAGLEVFCLFTEPGFEVLGHLPSDRFHWHYIPPSGQDLASMIQAATFINTMSFESLTKVSDTNRQKYNQFVDVLRAIQNFPDDRTGQTFGDVTEWNTDRVFVLDSLSGINSMVMNLVVGGKPVRSQADWGVAQNTLEALLQKLCTDTQCWFVLVAHAEREVDEVIGGVKIMVSTLGKKLAPKIPRFFSDVVLAQKLGAAFTWSTANALAELKNRNLANADGLPQTFVPIVENWKKQGGLIMPTGAAA